MSLQGLQGFVHPQVRATDDIPLWADLGFQVKIGKKTKLENDILAFSLDHTTSQMHFKTIHFFTSSSSK